MNASFVSQSITSRKILLVSASSVLALAAASPVYAQAEPGKATPVASALISAIHHEQGILKYAAVRAAPRLESANSGGARSKPHDAKR